VNFLNFEDPDVLERFVGTDYKKFWKETYGFDYAAKLSKPVAVNNSSINIAVDHNYLGKKYCLKAEFR
jgi:hypothetical protein